MLIHLNENEKKPKRIVVLGSNGFIGSAIMNLLQREDVEIIGLNRTHIDLADSTAFIKLANLLRADDVLVFVSARAPCKNIDMLIENLQISRAVCEALKLKPVEHLIYISSDAVYKDSDGLITEKSCTEPNSIHGVMHLTREILLKQTVTRPLAIVRPTLVYGENDPHNGYGPNQFRRLAIAGKEIVLFGEGEEQRDHIFIEDLAILVYKIALRKSTGIINAVSGEVVTFKEIALLTMKQINPNLMIRGVLRCGPMPHNGYRAFDNSSMTLAFPSLQFKKWKEGITFVNDQVKSKMAK